MTDNQPPDPPGLPPRQPPPQPAGSRQYSPPPQTASPLLRTAGQEQATTALILGILGLLCCGPLAIIALIMGNNARKESQSTGLPLDSTMNIAWIIGIIGTAILALQVCFFTVALLVSLSGS